MRDKVRIRAGEYPDVSLRLDRSPLVSDPTVLPAPAGGDRAAPGIPKDNSLLSDLPNTHHTRTNHQVTSHAFERYKTTGEDRIHPK